MNPRRLRAWLRVLPGLAFSDLNYKVRVLFCLLVGVIFQWIGQKADYDTRFYLRGAIPAPEDVLLIELSKDDLPWISGINPNSAGIRSLKEIVETSDLLFWNPSIWKTAIRNLSAAKPSSVLVTLFWDSRSIDDTYSTHDKNFFRDAPVFWASKTDASGQQLLLSAFARKDRSNTGLIELRADPDNQVRHFWLPSKAYSHVVTEMFKKEIGNGTILGRLIHFAGPSGTFSADTFQNLVQGRIPKEKLAGKHIVIGIKDFGPHMVQTPVGVMTAAELQANIINNFVHNRWVTDIPLWLGLLILCFILGVCLWILNSYPQTVAFVFNFFLCLIVIAVSAVLFDIYSIRLITEGPIAIVIVTYVVMSSYKLAESERYNWQFEKELQNLAELEELKNNFLSLISHDLKNPIAKIQGITDRLLAPHTPGLPQDLQQDLSSIQRISEELRKYITSLLNLTRVEARNIKLTKEVCDINSIIQEAIHRIEHLAQQKQIEISSELEPLFSMEVDPTLISEVLINLLENAIKYSPAGSKVMVSSSEVGNDVRIEVRDQGPGIREEDLPKVFDRFYRGSGNEHEKISGSGLGLYLVKYFIELHQGKVFIDSRRGAGTTVGFTLPIEEPEESYAELTSSYS